MESSSNHMACLLRIESPTPGWEKSLEKLFKANDVSFIIDRRSKTVYLYGKTDPRAIIEKIMKTGTKVEIVWSNHGSQNPQENRNGQLMQQQFNAPGFMNAPNGYGLPNYHPQGPQQFYYPHPPPHWNPFHPQPSLPQMFNLPPPYPCQPLPGHPPPPARYVYHQNEPAAKSFPPTPAPPKNFTMGDLQLGCMIM